MLNILDTFSMGVTVFDLHSVFFAIINHLYIERIKVNKFNFLFPNVVAIGNFSLWNQKNKM